MATRRERLPCGCRARIAAYPKRPGNDWGRVDVDPACTKKKKPCGHWSELQAMADSTKR